MKRNTLDKDYIKGVIQSFLLCLVIAGFVFVPYIISGGGLLTMGDDWDAQELAFQMFAGRELKAGNVFFNWSIDIGSELISSFSFYNLGSPFFWLTLLFPAELIPYMLGPILMLKYAVAGVCAYIWLRSILTDRSSAVACSLLYAFSGFQATNMIFYHFHDAVAFFPLLLWGLDKCVQEKKRGIFAATVALNALVNWNFFIAEVLFLIVYYCVRYNFISKLKGPDRKESVTELFGIIGEGALGVAASAILFFPTIRSMLYLDRIGDTISLKDAFVFSLKDVLLNLRGLLLPADAMNNQTLFEQFNWYSISAYLPMTGMAGALAWILYSRGQKDRLSRMLIICMLVAMIPGLNNAFVMFNKEPYRRWYYMPILIMCLATGKVFESLVSEETGTKVETNTMPTRSCYRCLMLAGSITIASIALLPFLLKAARPVLGLEKVVLITFNWAVLLGLAVTGIVVLCVIGYAGHKRITQRIYMLLTAGIAVFAFLSTANTFREYRISAYYTPREVYNEIVNTGKPLEADILPYRYSMVDDYYNRDMAWSMTSIDSFISTVDSGIHRFYDAIGTPRHNLTMTGPEGTERLLSVRYYISKDPEVESISGLPEINNYDIGSAQVGVYEDVNALPIGFAYDSYMTRSEFDRIDPTLRAMAMLRSMVVCDEDESLVSGVLKHYVPDEDRPFNESNMEEDCDFLRERCVTDFRHSTKGFSGRINLEKPAYVFFSVPYANPSCWSADISGVKQQILEVNGLMAVYVPEGEQVIEISYNTGLHVFSLVISLLAVSCILILIYKGQVKNH